MPYQQEMARYALRRLAEHHPDPQTLYLLEQLAHYMDNLENGYEYLRQQKPPPTLVRAEEKLCAQLHEVEQLKLRLEQQERELNQQIAIRERQQVNFHLGYHGVLDRIMNDLETRGYSVCRRLSDNNWDPDAYAPVSNRVVHEVAKKYIKDHLE